MPHVGNLLLGVVLLLGAGCLGEPKDAKPFARFPALFAQQPIPQHEPPSTRGNTSYEVWGQRYHPMKSAEGYQETGIASWYGTKFHGRQTSMGEPYDVYRLTAAHRTLPLPSYVKVTNLNNNKTVILRVNDRGPFHADRILDVSYAAAVQLGMDHLGTAPVYVEAINPTASPTRGPEASGVVYYVQVGAFQEIHNARQLVRRLKKRWHPHIRHHKKQFLVQMGPYTHIPQAQMMLQKAQQFGLSHAFVVRETTH